MESARQTGRWAGIHLFLPSLSTPSFRDMLTCVCWRDLETGGFELEILKEPVNLRSHDWNGLSKFLLIFMMQNEKWKKLKWLIKEAKLRKDWHTWSSLKIKPLIFRWLVCAFIQCMAVPAKCHVDYFTFLGYFSTFFQIGKRVSLDFPISLPPGPTYQNKPFLSQDDAEVFMYLVTVLFMLQGTKLSLLCSSSSMFHTRVDL